MQISIVNVEVSKVKTYQVAEIVYKNLNGEVKTWKLMSFSNPAVFAILKDAKQGEVFDITTGKNDKDYTIWTAAKKSDGTAEATGSPAAKTVGKVLGSNYETADERAARQRLIVRQSSLSAAIGVLSPGAKAALDPAAVIKLAEEFTDWVFEPEKVDLVNMEDDIPY